MQKIFYIFINVIMCICKDLSWIKWYLKLIYGSFYSLIIYDIVFKSITPKHVMQSMSNNITEYPPGSYITKKYQFLLICKQQFLTSNFIIKNMEIPKLYFGHSICYMFQLQVVWATFFANHVLRKQINILPTSIGSFVYPCCRIWIKNSLLNSVNKMPKLPKAYSYFNT